MIYPYNKPPTNIAIKPVRGIREMSIPLAPGDETVGLTRISFQNAYYFNSFYNDPIKSPGQYGSLLHGNVGSRYPVETATDPTSPAYRAYFNAAETATNSKGEDVQTGNSPPDTAGQPIQVPLHGANLLSFAFNAISADNQSDLFKLTLCRGVAPTDLSTFLGSNAFGAMAVAQWGPVQSSQVGAFSPTFQESGFMLPVATSFFLVLQNITSQTDTNWLMGSIFLHG